MLESGLPIELVATQLNSPGLAALAATSQNASTAIKQLYLIRDKALAQSQANRLAGASQNVNALQQANLPPSAGSPNLPRRAVNTALAQQQAALASQQTARADQLAKVESNLAQKEADLTSGLTTENIAAQQAHGVKDPNQPVIGDIISGEAKDARGAAKLVNKQLYDEAFKLAGDAKVDVQSLITKAEEILGKPLSEFDPKTAHPIINRLLKLKNEAPPVPETGGGGFLAPLVSKKPQAAPPATATLEDLDAIRSAINAAVREAKTSPNVDPKLRNLTQLQDVITKLVKDSSAVTPEAKAAYSAAVDQYKNNYVPKFKTGVQENLFRRTNVSENKIRPEDVTNAFFKGESEANQFVAMLGDNPVATQALKNGIEGLYFSKVAKNGQINTSAHADFMHTNRKTLDILDQTGMGIRDRLDSLGKAAIAKEGELAVIPSKVAGALAPEKASLETAKAAEKATISAENTALQDAAKGLSFRTTGELRKSVIQSEATMNQALRRMDEPAKAALARGVMQDALATGNGEKILTHLTTNERPIMAALRASNPKTAEAIFAKAKDTAEVQKLIDGVRSKVPENKLSSGDRLQTLTQGLPEVRKVVKQIQSELESGATFEKLAAQGKEAGGGVLGLASKAAGPTIASLSHEMTIYNTITNRLKGKLNEKLAAEIAVTMLDSAAAAKAIKQAQTATERSATRSAMIKNELAKAQGLAKSPNALIANQLGQPLRIEVIGGGGQQ
jgi:hypothetical protein